MDPALIVPDDQVGESIKSECALAAANEPLLAGFLHATVLSQPDIEATLNMGVGMAAVLPGEQADAARELLAARGLDAWVCGEIIASEGAASVELVGEHRG